ncbi:hypothetical protein [Anaerosporobacter faecicola]|uniref:hypothetical protein n=1 Tax=Anaerosporobacter faecicola TaxID=2718714 RepID=UPI001438F91C|nr:hypothetical protein [Anaerosporobacter faecicola]
MGISETEIEEYLKQLNVIPKQQASVWGSVMPSLLNMALFGPTATLFDLRYHILHSTDREIVIIGVDSITGKMRPEHTIIPIQQIKNIELKKGVIANKLIIESEIGVMKYRINKTMVGSKWHKVNLHNFLTTIR